MHIDGFQGQQEKTTTRAVSTHQDDGGVYGLPAGPVADVGQPVLLQHGLHPLAVVEAQAHGLGLAGAVEVHLVEEPVAEDEGQDQDAVRQLGEDQLVDVGAVRDDVRQRLLDELKKCSYVQSYISLRIIITCMKDGYHLNVMLANMAGSSSFRTDEG